MDPTPVSSVNVKKLSFVAPVLKDSKNITS